MLAVIAEFTPNHGSRGPGQGLIVSADGLAVTFHLQLLQERGEELQGVVIGKNRLGRGLELIGVPVTD